MSRILLLAFVVALAVLESSSLPVLDQNAAIKSISDRPVPLNLPVEKAAEVVVQPEKLEDPLAQQPSQQQQEEVKPAQEQQEAELLEKAAEPQQQEAQQQQQEEQLDEKASPPKESDQQNIKQRKLYRHPVEVFEKHDSDIDGYIDESEFQIVYKFPSDVLKKAFSSADADENLKLDKEEFAKVSFDESPVEEKKSEVVKEEELKDVAIPEEEAPVPPSEDKKPEEAKPEEEVASLKSETDLQYNTGKPIPAALEEDEDAKKGQEIPQAAQPQAEEIEDKAAEEQKIPEKAEDEKKEVVIVEESKKEPEELEGRSVEAVPVIIEDLASKPSEDKKQEEQKEPKDKPTGGEEIMAIVSDESSVPVIVPEQPSEIEQPVILVPAEIPAAPVEAAAPEPVIAEEPQVLPEAPVEIAIIPAEESAAIEPVKAEEAAPIIVAIDPIAPEKAIEYGLPAKVDDAVALPEFPSSEQ